MKKECNKFKADITDYARGEYGYIKDYDALFNHLRECADCRNHLLELEELFYHLRAADGPSPEFQKKMDEIRAMAKKGPPPLIEKDKEDTPLKRGIALYKKQNWLEAVKAFDEAVKQSPKDPNAYYHHGLALKRMNRLEGALTALSRAIELDPEDADAYFHRGEIYRRWGWTDNALKDFNKAIQLNPDYTEAYYQRGLIWSYLYEGKLAIQEYTQAIKVDPRFIPAYTERGIEYAKAHQPDQAIADFTKAITLAPKEVDSYHNRGVVYARQGDLKKAMADFKKALQISPDFELSADALKKIEQELATHEIEAKIKKVEQEIATRYKKDKVRLKTRYEAEIKQLQARIKHLEETQKMLLEIAKQRPEYHYHITAKEAPGMIIQPASWVDRPAARAFSHLRIPEEKE